MKKIIFTIGIFKVLFVVSLESITFREIFSFSNYSYSNRPQSVIYENSFIAQINRDYALILRLTIDDRQFWKNNIYTFGGVLNLSRNSYIEIYYGIGIDSNNDKTNYYNLDFIYEKRNLLMGIGNKFSDYGNYKSNLISPYLQYYLISNTRFWIKHFSSVDSEKNYDYANWIEVEQYISNFSFKLGVTNGDRIYDFDYGIIQDNYMYSWLLGLSYKFKEKFWLKYIFEYFVRENSYNGIKNVFIVDFRL
ncbi:MAG: hypothetical protein SNJ64_02040 [Endomicrobiia bacterium]